MSPSSAAAPLAPAGAPTTPPDAGAGDAQLDQLGAHIERLLEDIEPMVGPVSWPRVEELVRALVELYGAGLSRVLGYAREAARDEDTLLQQLGLDALVSSLLSLHDLQPSPPEQRIARCIDEERPRLIGLAEDVEVLRSADAELIVRVLGASPEPSARKAVAHLLDQVFAKAAPELASVHVEGLDLPRPEEPIISLEHVVRHKRKS